MTDTVLSLTPLSRGYRAALEAELKLQQPRYAPISELRALPRVKLLRTLRGIDAAEVHLAVEDIHSQVALPFLEVIGALTATRTMRVVYPDLRTKQLPKYRALQSVATLSQQSALGWLAILRAWTDTRRMLSAERLEISHSTAPRRILYLKTNFMLGLKAGGSVGHIQGIVDGFADSGYALRYCSSEPPLHGRPEVEYVEIPLPNTFGYPFEANYYAYHHEYVARLGRILDARDYRFIYHRMSICNYAGVVISRRLKTVPLIIEYNGSDAWIQKHWDRPMKFQQLAENVEQVSIRHAHIVVTQSEVLRQELLGRGVAPDRIVVYPNCVDDTHFCSKRFSEAESSALRERLQIPADAVVVTFVGTFGQWHGTEVLAEAIRRLADTRPDWLRRSRVRFLFIGDGLKMPAVKRILDAPGCRDYCTMTGLIPQRDAPAYLAASDVLVSPHVPNTDGTRFFGSPTKLFEYMSMGKGIVASDLEQLGEVLRDSLRVGELPTAGPAPSATQLAVLSRPGSVEGLMEGIAFLVDHYEWRSALGRNARREVERRYTWSHHVGAILERFDQLYPVASGPGVRQP